MPRKSSSSSPDIGRSGTTRNRKRSTSRRVNTRMRSCKGGNSHIGTSRTGARRVRSSKSSAGSSLSARTRKVIDALPLHAQEIYGKAHKNALKQYATPSKRRAGKSQSKEQVAHKVAWSAVKKEYKKKGDKWVPKED